MKLLVAWGMKGGVAKKTTVCNACVSLHGPHEGLASVGQLQDLFPDGWRVVVTMVKGKHC